jgi:hypothetical protein
LVFLNELRRIENCRGDWASGLQQRPWRPSPNALQLLPARCHSCCASPSCPCLRRFHIAMQPLTNDLQSPHTACQERTLKRFQRLDELRGFGFFKQRREELREITALWSHNRSTSDLVRATLSSTPEALAPCHFHMLTALEGLDATHDSAPRSCSRRRLGNEFSLISKGGETCAEISAEFPHRGSRSSPPANRRSLLQRSDGPGSGDQRRRTDFSSNYRSQLDFPTVVSPMQ